MWCCWGLGQRGIKKDRVADPGVLSTGEGSNEDGRPGNDGDTRFGMEWWVVRSDRIGLKLFKMCCHLKKFVCEWKREWKVGREGWKKSDDQKLSIHGQKRVLNRERSPYERQREIEHFPGYYADSFLMLGLFTSIHVNFKVVHILVFLS